MNSEHNLSDKIYMQISRLICLHWIGHIFLKGVLFQRVVCTVSKEDEKENRKARGSWPMEELENYNL